MKNIIDKATTTHTLTYEEIVSLLKDNTCDEYLFKKADQVRMQYVGNAVHLRGLIEFSNVCGRNCLYCGLRKDNSKLERYMMSEDEIFETAKNAAAMGYKTVVLQSGESE